MWPWQTVEEVEGVEALRGSTVEAVEGVEDLRCEPWRARKL
jgi:hypothetical protein